MKKFLITLLILIALAGTAFFFGWANFAVPPGAYGVISSKTHGIDPEIVQAGEFRWIWYKLIPTNVKIYNFNLEKQQFPIEFNSTLPSGDIYAQFVGLVNSEFSFNLEADISFAVKPEKIVDLVTAQNLKSQDDLYQFMSDTSNNIKILILNTLSSPEMDSDRLESILSGSRDAELEKDIRNKFPELQDFSFVIKTAKYPDFLLYRQIRMIYEEFLSKQREFISISFGQRAESHIESQLFFSELEKYGELLTKYPVLLEYLALKDTDKR